MGVYLPPDGSKNPSTNLPRASNSGENGNDSAKFYVRPSLGLKLWGPLVPASDNRIGLWTLISIQTAVGLLCMSRFRSLGNGIIKKDISQIPSLNRFSTTHGKVYMAAHGPTTFGGTHSFRISDAGRLSFFNSPRFMAIKRSLYLLGGSILLSQSLLETCRLTILKYDPWYEEARSVRDKQFFNDIIKFYHEGVDATKFKVKDATSGNVLPLNIPEVKQSVAVARATTEADTWVSQWYGPLNFKPMSFSEFLDKIEYHLEMVDFLRDKRTKDVAAKLLGKQLHQDDAEKIALKKGNKESRERIYELVKNAPKNSMHQIFSRPTGANGIMLGPEVHNADEIDLSETWSTFSPWLDLALETSLSIKFLPTVLMSEDDAANKAQSKPDDDQNDREVTGN
ncbi:LAMI_0F00936g1_1 [Lachancea mirantina]|uniref:LAMI_0F00936g1_1 n=1 Tax=Lachancea mirantina TaxID=1230905 RepID=A0A1G4JW00_9SACH|nr:LAMI_0F00936g1_1 [Lachancea mirantina]